MLAWAVTERSYGNSEKILKELNTEGRMLDAKKEVGVKRRLAEIPTMAIDSKEMLCPLMESIRDSMSFLCLRVVRTILEPPMRIRWSLKAPLRPG